MTDLVERLLQVEGRTTQYYRNPDGPEAADEIKQLRARVAELERALKPYAHYYSDYDPIGRAGKVLNRRRRPPMKE